jgi:carbamoyltransferase
MIHWGVNALNHEHGIAVFKDNRFIDNYVGQHDQISRLNIDLSFEHGIPDRIFWYENPWIKKIRQIYAGQYNRAFDFSVLPKNYMNLYTAAPITYTSHHASHAAAGYYTSPFSNCAIVVLDAIGEFECATIWQAKHDELHKVWSRSYPNSLGLFYSAFTKLVGHTPIKDEYLLQNMAELGDSTRYYNLVLTYMNGLIQSQKNLHRGISDWPYEIKNLQDKCDIAAAVQRVFEIQIESVMIKAKQLTDSDSLVYMGGCAMNSKTNKDIVEPMWKYIWSLPNPGDESSGIGAVLYHTKHRASDHQWNLVKHITIKV